MKTFFNLPQDILSYIYQFDDTYRKDMNITISKIRRVPYHYRNGLQILEVNLHRSMIIRKTFTYSPFDVIVEHITLPRSTSTSFESNNIQYYHTSFPQ